MAADRLDYLRRRPWRDIDLPPGIVGVPTMLSKIERKLLYLLALDYAADDAAIVDAGCFLGGSTVALLSGLRDRAERWAGPPVASYDLFRVEAYTIPQFFRDHPSIDGGSSFRHLFDANVASFDVTHVVHEGDITEIGWSGGPIDVLFLDVVKSWEINDAILRDFFPSLVPGRSVIVQQDYGWGYLPWIPLTVELMWDSLSLIDGMEWGSHVFLLKDEVPQYLIEEGVRNLDLDTQLDILDRTVDRFDGPVRGMLEMSRTAVIAERDGMEAALRDLDRIADAYAEYENVLGCVAHVREGLATDWTFPSATKRRNWRGGRFGESRRRLSAAFRRRIASPTG